MQQPQRSVRAINRVERKTQPKDHPDEPKALLKLEFCSPHRYEAPYNALTIRRPMRFVMKRPPA
jgi:hypothetical protein